MHTHIIIEMAGLAAACVGLFPLTSWLDNRKKLNAWLDRVIGPEIGKGK